MTDEEGLRKELHQRVDAACDSRIEDIEEERRNSHRWIDGAPLSVLTAITANYDNVLASQPQPRQTAYSPSNGLDPEASERFPYKDAIRQLILSVDEDTDISTPPVYNYLKDNYLEIRNNPKMVNVRAQIASALNKLANKDHLIYIYKEGGGSIPHIYRRAPKEIDEAINKAVEAVTGPIGAIQQGA